MGNTTLLVVMIIILVIIFIAVIASLVFANKALVEVKKYTDWDSDQYLSEAVKYLTWTVTVSWITLGLIIFGGAFLVFYSFEKVTSALHWIVSGLLLLTIVSAIIIGVVASIAAKNINDSGLRDTDDNINQGYKDCVYAAVISILSVSLLVIAGIIYLIYRYQKSKTEKVKTAMAVEAAKTTTPAQPAATTPAQPVATTPVEPAATVTKTVQVTEKPAPVVITA